MKTNFLFLLFIIINGVISAQDNIIKKNGDEIKAKVIEIGTSEIKYKKFTNQSGPTYVILKSEVFMIKYEDGSKDVINAIVPESKPEAPSQTEVKTSSPTPTSTPPPATPTTTTSKKKYNYIEKVREVQSEDPSFSIYAGNGWLLGPGILNPLFGVEIRMPRKNVFLRGLSVGARASFKHLDSREEIAYTEIYGFGVVVKYFAPIPIKVIQPYVIANLGAAMFNYYTANGYVQYSSGSSWKYSVTSGVSPYGGFGVGSNFMIAKHFGLFIELGYFTTAAINTGLVLKF